jgi:FKBP-type peptidyl-prolyl cis-trans isomerase 2
MSKATNGDGVKVHYTGQLISGDVFDTSKDRQPLEFEIGSGKVIPGFEKGVIDMEVGESKRITIEPEEAYGQRREELVVNVMKIDLPDHITPTVGRQLQMQQQDGSSVKVIIAEIDEDNVTIDANHPLAGHTLYFDVELVDIF